NRMLYTSLGRWHGRDPLQAASTVNKYEYASSSPIPSVDPFGLFGICLGCVGSGSDSDSLDGPNGNLHADIDLEVWSGLCHSYANCAQMYPCHWNLNVDVTVSGLTNIQPEAPFDPGSTALGVYFTQSGKVYDDGIASFFHASDDGVYEYVQTSPID